MSRRKKQLSESRSRRAEERELRKINKAILKGTTFSNDLLTTQVKEVGDGCFSVNMDLGSIKIK